MSDFDPRAYLLERLPGLLGLASTPRLNHPAVIQWIVADRSDCDLAYRVSNEGIQVVEELADEVDLTLAFFSADLRAFSEQTLDVARALRTRRLKINGDETLLAWMAERLAIVASGAELSGGAR